MQEQAADGFVAKRPCHSPPELFVREDSQHVVQRGIRLFQGCHEHVTQDVLHAHSPRLWPHLLEDIHHAGRGERDAILPDMTQRIVAVRLFRIGGVQIDDVVPPRRRSACRDTPDEIPMRIDQREAMPVLQVLERHVLQKRRFPRAGLTDDVNMRKSIFVPDPEDAVVAAKIDPSEARDLIRIHTGAHLPRCGSCARGRKFCRDSTTSKGRVSVRLASVSFNINAKVVGPERVIVQIDSVARRRGPIRCLGRRLYRSWRSVSERQRRRIGRRDRMG